MKKLLLCLALVSGSAQAEFLDGNKLLSDMQGSNTDQIHAIGYVVGVADAIRGVAYCPPENITAGQLTDMVRNYLINTPAIRHNTGDRIVSHVLKTVWPCAKRQQGTGV
jgi:hypothetical protein